MRVLIVEDDEKIASFLERGLSAHGYQVTLADRGDDGLELALTPEVGLVILDLSLPGAGRARRAGDAASRGQMGSAAKEMPMRSPPATVAAWIRNALRRSAARAVVSSTASCCPSCPRLRSPAMP